MKERWEEECASFEVNRYNAGEGMKRSAFAMQQCIQRIAFVGTCRKCRISLAFPGLSQAISIFSAYFTAATCQGSWIHRVAIANFGA